MAFFRISENLSDGRIWIFHIFPIVNNRWQGLSLSKTFRILQASPAVSYAGTALYREYPESGELLQGESPFPVIPGHVFTGWSFWASPTPTPSAFARAIPSFVRSIMFYRSRSATHEKIESMRSRSFLPSSLLRDSAWIATRPVSRTLLGSGPYSAWQEETGPAVIFRTRSVIGSPECSLTNWIIRENPSRSCRVEIPDMWST